MNTAEEFEVLAKEWAKYCNSIWISSNTLDYLNHSAYRKLVEMGKPAIPYIIERYKKRDSFCEWGFVLDEITGLDMVGYPDNFDRAEVRKRWIEWWEQQQTIE